MCLVFLIWDYISLSKRALKWNVILCWASKHCSNWEKFLWIQKQTMKEVHWTHLLDQVRKMSDYHRYLETSSRSLNQLTVNETLSLWLSWHQRTWPLVKPSYLLNTLEFLRLHYHESFQELWLPYGHEPHTLPCLHPRHSGGPAGDPIL